MPFNVTIIGAGPVGISAACAIKAINPHLNVTVLDKRVERERSYGLSVDSSSTEAITDIVEEALKTLKDEVHRERVINLRNIVR